MFAISLLRRAIKRRSPLTASQMRCIAACAVSSQAPARPSHCQKHPEQLAGQRTAQARVWSFTTHHAALPTLKAAAI